MQQNALITDPDHTWEAGDDDYATYDHEISLVRPSAPRRRRRRRPARPRARAAAPFGVVSVSELGGKPPSAGRSAPSARTRPRAAAARARARARGRAPPAPAPLDAPRPLAPAAVVAMRPTERQQVFADKYAELAREEAADDAPRVGDVELDDLFEEEAEAARAEEEAPQLLEYVNSAEDGTMLPLGLIVGKSADDVVPDPYAVMGEYGVSDPALDAAGNSVAAKQMWREWIKHVHQKPRGNALLFLRNVPFQEDLLYGPPTATARAKPPLRAGPRPRDVGDERGRGGRRRRAVHSHGERGGSAAAVERLQGTRHALPLPPGARAKERPLKRAAAVPRAQAPCPSACAAGAALPADDHAPTLPKPRRPAPRRCRSAGCTWAVAKRALDELGRPLMERDPETGEFRQKMVPRSYGLPARAARPTASASSSTGSPRRCSSIAPCARRRHAALAGHLDSPQREPLGVGLLALAEE